ncbi:hypothetical protein ikelab_09490 [Lactococcus garvieae]|uniref:BspA family leucine-rich repeat surface protein n=1 Tax=Lactococcus garvieae TaxID=1363 RepID=A0A6L2ZWA2_9LACT|nr:BspA family leucine-rich repeat surface protein [Lactococcus garvieae]GFO51674.1 hypothetical protein ikelab_09490 [Lactococcus garvieae]
MTNYGLGELTAGTYIADRLRWGSSLWTFNEDTGTLTLESGQLGEFNSSDNPAPWKRTDENAVSADKIRKIVLNGKVTAPQSSHQLFANLQNLEEIVNLQNLDTSMVNNMYSMFAGDTRLVSLDLSLFETSNVSRMSSMFKNTSSLTQLDLSAFNTDKVNDMSNMFEEASSLTSLDLSNFNTSNVTAMQNMFYKATNLTSLNLGSFDTSNAENMAMMFKDMNKLNTLTLGNKFKFKNNSALGAPAPVNIGNGSTGRWIRNDYQTKAYSPIDFMTNYGLGELTAGTYIAERLRWGTAPWTFDESTGVLTVEGGELGGSGTTPWGREDEYRIDIDDIQKIIFTEPVIAPQNSEGLFSYLRSLEEIEGLSLLDTSKVTNMKMMFSNLPLLEQLDIEHFNTSSVRQMDGMFEGAESVTSLNLNNWDVSKVETIAGMFAATVSLQNLQVSNWDTHNVKKMESLFYYAMSLKELDLTNWNTLNVEDGQMWNMFTYVKLKRLTLGDSFKFQKGTGLSKPSPLHQGDITTGKWIREDGASEAYTPEEFTSNYGTGDLKAGAYIAEATAKANLVVDFEAHPKDNIVNNTVGKTSEITLNIFNNGAQNSSETQVTLEKYDTQFETTSSEVQLSYLDKDGNETRKQTIPAGDFKEGFVFDEKLGYNEKIKVSFEGIPWNNSPEETKDMDQVTISYHNGSKNTQASWTGTTFIANGTFGFKTVPEPLSFKKTPLSLDLNGKKIERE